MIELDEYRESAALSAGGQFWQSVRCRAFVAAVATVMLAAPAMAVPGGAIGTMQRGGYACELAGDAMGEPGIAQPAEGFTILHSSIYSTASGRGSYLLTGDLLTMTSGPKMGEHYKRVSENFVRRLTDDGQESNLRCIRRVSNNG